jgi:hypothetical protein
MTLVARIVLDRRENCGEMNEANAVVTFSMFRSDSVRLIRLQPMGPTHAGEWFFGIAGFKIYGSLLSPHFEQYGLISLQTYECGKNVHHAGLVICSASGKCDEWPAKNVADPGPENVFFSEDKPNQWICHNFDTKKVQPTADLPKSAADTLCILQTGMTQKVRSEL